MEGTFETGWLVLFTQAETDAIADSVDKVALLVGLLPEPVTSTVLNVGVAIVGIAAAVAKKKRLALGLRLRVPGTYSKWRQLNLYDLMAPPVFPFFFSEVDPASLARWRERFPV